MIRLIWTFLKMGLFGFGGGYAIIPLLQAELEINGWMSKTQFAVLISISQMTPGPIGINAATFIGLKTYGLIGGIVSTISLVLIPFIIVISICFFLGKNTDNKIVKSVLLGIRPVTIGMILSAGIFFALNSFIIDIDNILSFTFSNIDFKAFIIFAIILTLSIGYRKIRIHPILAIVVSGVLGAIIL